VEIGIYALYLPSDDDAIGILYQENEVKNYFILFFIFYFIFDFIVYWNSI